LGLARGGVDLGRVRVLRSVARVSETLEEKTFLGDGVKLLSAWAQ
jgi:hypothetical protein